MASQKTEIDWCLYNAWRICHPMFWWHIEILSLEAATTLCNFFIQLLCERNVFSVIMVCGVCYSQCILVVVLYPAVGYSKFMGDTEKILKVYGNGRDKKGLYAKMEEGMK